MTQSRLVLAVAIAALTFGVTGAKVASATQLQSDTVIAADDTAPSAPAGAGSAKMGEGEGTQSGDEGATQENDTQKVDQPARRNETTGNETDQGDAAPPSEDSQDTAK